MNGASQTPKVFLDSLALQNKSFRFFKRKENDRNTCNSNIFFTFNHLNHTQNTLVLASQSHTKDDQKT